MTTHRFLGLALGTLCVVSAAAGPIDENQPPPLPEPGSPHAGTGSASWSASSEMARVVLTVVRRGGDGTLQPAAGAEVFRVKETRRGERKLKLHGRTDAKGEILVPVRSVSRATRDEVVVEQRSRPIPRAYVVRAEGCADLEVEVREDGHDPIELECRLPS